MRVFDDGPLWINAEHPWVPQKQFTIIIVNLRKHHHSVSSVSYNA